MKVKFIGGAGTVTGSKTVIETTTMVVLIDCGLFQGIKPLRELNWEPFPMDASLIDAVLLTHGHLDHCGWLPRLVQEGFQGKIYCTSPTKAVAKLIIMDSAKIQEEEAEKAMKEKYSIHEVPEPLYTVEQAKKVFSLFKVVKPSERIAIGEGVEVIFDPVGHIIGACSITVVADGKTLVFSGDIGRDNDVLLYPPMKPKEADYVFLESTYGDRLHPDTDVKLELETYITTTFHKGGTVIIPSFAVERAQTVMYLLWQLKKEGRIPTMPYIVDSPMGIGAFEVFLQNTSWHKLTPEICQSMRDMFIINSDYEETLQAIYDKGPKVVIAASGMVTGGRVLSYLEYYIGIPETTIIIVGYQAEGTRGRKLLEGAKAIKIYGNYYTVRANVLEIQGLSAHGDQMDLVDWLSDLKAKPKKIFLVHGENEPADALRIKIKEVYGYPCTIPLMGQERKL
ncbi:MBL fold metallo-hydrolase RNA specificity domain-containing protein [Flavobacterium sp. UMI-01]|uniref:MBL fold metallo-hydrolase RNA specificity domain-containing protein n=1 Tax=Flavobacterium sp. UMI-01 TaxID=1441053 RepID=UPI001C7E1249|nr:MBL fold metallo-hydrolase [Flavobacterium sp. UMI-01]GIZ08921.1 MBL fold metallo-hydrolase [Flavobacterium sp. UMI-01]